MRLMDPRSVLTKGAALAPDARAVGRIALGGDDRNPALDAEGRSSEPRLVTQASEVLGRVVFGAWVLLLALSAVPIFSTVLPPLVDYPNHLARFYLLARGGND